MNDTRTVCPDWCVQEHPEGELPEDAWHRSATIAVPVVGWFPPAAEEPEGATVYVARVLPAAGGEVRARIEADGWGEVDVDLSSAARLGAALAATATAPPGERS
ncbi:hypothetical protein HQQ81_03030 [Microbacteriaceae bacterium VKM Ac-2854]|nr:hypothetical protein [Microbacteriaceae bacterium VKM Ac-2854]